MQRDSKPPLRHPRICYAIAFTMLIVVAVVSLIPAPAIGPSDKLLHLLTYSALSAGFALLVRHFVSLLVVAFGLVLYGVVLEILQGLTGYRMMDGGDMLANSIGVLIGLAVWFSLLPHWFRRIESNF